MKFTMKLSILFFIMVVAIFFLYNVVYGNPSLKKTQQGEISVTQQQEKITMQTRWIGKDSEYETPYYVFNSNTPQPVVLIEAGIHGDELAGVYALNRLLPKIQISSGTLIIFPKMNILACNAEKRFINKDLNLIFPGRKDGKFYEFKLAREIYEMVAREKVEYLLTLHESRYLHDVNKPRTFGQTIVYGVQPVPEYLADWLKQVNRRVLHEKEIFHPYYFPVEGSSTETMVADYNLKGGFCIETWRNFPMERRVQLQSDVVLTFLDTIKFKYSLLVP